MKYFTLFAVPILFLAKVQSNEPKDSNDSRKFQDDSQINIITEINKITKFEDLNDDCHLIIHEQLHITDLISLAFTSKYFSHLAEYNLGQRFAKKTVVLASLLYVANYSIEETRDSFWFQCTATAVNVLQRFGHLMRKLKIGKNHVHYDIKLAAEISTFVQLIEERCAEHLVELHVIAIGKILFQNITACFPKLETFVWQLDIFDLKDRHLDLANHFPALRNFQLNNIKTLNANHLSMAFQHLEHLSVNIYLDRMAEPQSGALVIKVIKMNSHIHSLYLRDARPNILEVVADELANLKNLEIYGYSERDTHFSEINFTHLTKLKIINCYGQSIPVHAHFGIDLLEFEVQYYPRDSKFIDLIEQNKGLEIFRMYGPYGLRNVEILRLAAMKLNLIELAIICKWGVNEENIVELIKSGNRLERVYLSIEGGQPLTAHMISLLDIHFNDDWTIDDLNVTFFLQKKRSNSNLI